MRRLLTVVTGVGLCAFAVTAQARTTTTGGGNDVWYQFNDSPTSERSPGPRQQATGRVNKTSVSRRQTRRSAARTTRTRAAGSFLRRGAASTSRTCLTPAARALLGRIEAQFGGVQVISTCRPGARIAGSGRISRHASGNAVDFNANGNKAQVVRWLIANHRAGGVMTYAGMSHIHVDIGPRFVALNHGGRRRVASR
jgi:hypothetical protein